MRIKNMQKVFKALAPLIGLLLVCYLFDILNDCPHFFVKAPQVDWPVQENGGDEPVKREYHIHINLDDLTMYVFKNGGLLKTYPVSGGKASTPSPTGTWKIISKDTWGEGFGGAWLGFNVPWGIYGVHGTVEPWYVGKSNSSKGCIRMKNKDVQELYKIVPHGTTVTIEQNNRKFRITRSGDVGSDILEVQAALKKLNYYQGSLDGRFGTGLKNSVIKFQKDYGMAATGTVSRETYELAIKKAQSLKENSQEH